MTAICVERSNGSSASRVGGRRSAVRGLKCRRVSFESIEELEYLHGFIETVALACADLLDDARTLEFHYRILRRSPRDLETLGEIAGTKRRHVRERVQTGQQRRA